MAKPEQDIASQTVTLTELAQLVGHDPLTGRTVTGRRIQQLADTGILHRAGKGRYRLLASVQGYIHDLTAKLDGKDLEYNRERTEAMRLRRQKHEVEYLERLGKLVDAQEARTMVEKVFGLMRQRLLMAPKYLAPRMEGISANEAEPILEEYVRSTLAALAEPALGGVAHSGGPAHPAAAAEADRKPVGRRKKKAVRKDRR